LYVGQSEIDLSIQEAGDLKGVAEASGGDPLGSLSNDTHSSFCRYPMLLCLYWDRDR
jgi:hypothetical protein